MGNVNLTDNELITQIHQGNEDSIKELSKRHTGLYNQISRKYFGANTTKGRILFRDFLDERMYFFYKTAMKYKPEMGVKFSTFLGNEVRFHCLNTLNHDKSIRHVVFQNDYLQGARCNESSNEQLADEIEYEHYCTEGNSLEDELDTESIMILIRELKNEQITQIFQLKYFGDKEERTLDAIGNKLGISYEWVRKLHNSTIKHLQQKRKRCCKIAENVV